MLHVDPAKVGWQAIPNSAQKLALNAPVQSLLLTGGRGWGKTEAQLMRFRSRVGMGYGTHWRGIIFDKEYKNLDDLVVKSNRLFNDFDFGEARWHSSNSDFKWVWSTGEELLFRAASDERDYWNYHGHEYPFIGFNELTKYPTPKLYRMLLSTNRSGWNSIEHTPRLTGELADGNMTDVEVWNFAVDVMGRRVNHHYEGRPFQAGDYRSPDGRPLPDIPLEVVSTTNPYGPGHNWVKMEFVDPAPYGEIIKKTTVIFNPRTQEEEAITRRHVTLFGTFRENPYLSPQYIATMYEETDPNLIKAWLNGRWDIVAGGAFDDVWKPDTHIVPRFKVPSNWYVDRALDWGSSHPFSVGWFAEANGEEVTLEDGSKWCPQAGSIIQIGEIYGTKQIGTNIGLKWGAKDIAIAIKDYERELKEGGWVSGAIHIGPADNQISNVIDKDKDTIEKTFSDNGVDWEKSDKSPGSRVNGLQLFRDRLQAATKNEGPGFYFMANCRASIATIPILPRDEKKIDDVDTSAEDHPWDMVRYRTLKGNLRGATVIPFRFPR
jgi:hypothetical protein